MLRMPAILLIEQETGEVVVPLGTLEATAAEHATLADNLRRMFDTAAPKAEGWLGHPNFQLRTLPT